MPALLPFAALVVSNYRSDVFILLLLKSTGLSLICNIMYASSCSVNGSFSLETRSDDTSAMFSVREVDNHLGNILLASYVRSCH
jgi:hypothetical protein